MVFQLRSISRFLLINDSLQEELKYFYSFSWVPVWISSLGVEWLSVIEANFLSFLSFLDRHVGTFCTSQSTNIFVMEFFVVQTYPITVVGSCFHYPLQGIMDHFHRGFHYLEMVMELIVNCDQASFHKGNWWSTCKTYLWWRSLWFKLTRSLLAVAFITLSKESWIILIKGSIPWKW
jgi:hypothetical protein